MGRAGAGGGRPSSSSRSSGSRSSSRSSGGHRVGSSGSNRRAGAGGSPSFGSGFSRPTHRTGGPGMPPPPPRHMGPGMPPPPPRHTYRSTTRHVYHHNVPSGGTYSTGSSGGCGTVLWAMIIIFFIFIAFALLVPDSALEPSNSRNRDKAETGLVFDSNCIVDELGWFDSVSSAGRRLENFYNETGVQPYVVLRRYDPSLRTDADKEAFAQEYYENEIGNEGTFLFMYFAEEDTDNDVGYMCYVNGFKVNSVMDAEAVDIFWTYIDQYWFSNLSTDELFEEVFNHTAKTIMTKSKTSTDIIFVLVIGIMIVAIVVVIIIAMKTKRKNERERAEETQRILNTPLPTNPTSSTNDVNKQ